MENRRKYILEYVPLAIIIFLVLIILPISSVYVGDNAADYMCQANDILKGTTPGYMFPKHDVTRGSVYPMILASSFKLIGQSVYSASLATRLFFSMGIILVYLIGRIFYSKEVGLLASLFVLTSPGINRVANTIDTDIVHPFFILLFILLYYLSLNRSSRAWGVGAGICLGLALMVKESALFCFGLPLGMIIFATRDKRRDYVKLFGFTIGGCIICLLPWGVQVFLSKGTILPMLGLALPKAQVLVVDSVNAGSTFSDRFAVAMNVLQAGFVGFYTGILRDVTSLPIVLIFGWFFIVVRGFMYKKTNDLVLAISVLAFLPLILLIGSTLDARLGHTTFIWMLLYLAVAGSVVSCIGYFTDLLEARKSIIVKFSSNYRLILICFFGILFVFMELFLPGKTWRNWVSGPTSLAIFSEDSFKIYGRYTSDQEETAKWITENIHKDAKIIADGYINEALNFFGVRKEKIPAFHPTKGFVVKPGPTKKNNNIDDDDRPVYLITYHTFDSGVKRKRVIFPILEKDIMSVIKRENPDYIVISSRGLFFQAYFNHANWAELKYENSNVKIYKIVVSEIEHVIIEDICVNDSISRHLIWLKEKYPNEYNLHLVKLKELGLSVKELEESKCRFPVGQVY